MDTLLFSFNAVAPILLTILLGMLLRRLHLFSEATAAAVNKLCFSLFIPLNVFGQLYDADLRGAADPRYLGFGLGLILLTFALLCLLVPRFIKDGGERGEFIQGVFRGNISLISVSLLTNLYGAEGIRIMSFLLPLSIILYNSLSAVELSVFIRGGEKLTFSLLARKVVTNPIVIACALGVLFSLLRVPLPAFIGSTVKSVSAIGSPLALLAIGATINLKELSTGGGKALCAALIRQVALPVLALGAAVLLGLRGGQLGAILCIVCTPTATVGYVFALNAGGTGKLAARIVVYTNLLAFLSMFVSIAVLRGAGML